jgi:site-specific DNA-cytosine methylase
MGLGINDPRVIVFIMYCKLHRVWRTPILIHENVRGFSRALAAFLLGRDYGLLFLEVSPFHTCFNMLSRPRLFFIANHLQRTQMVCDPEVLLEQLSAEYMQDTSTVAHDIYLALKPEIAAEGVELCQRRCQMPLFRCGELGIDMWTCLSTTEQTYVKTYVALYVEKFGRHPEYDLETIFSLQDNPDNRTTWATNTGVIPCFRTGTAEHHMWIPALRRWLTSRERAAAMGFPSYSALAAIYGVPVTQQCSHHMLGNAMHVPTIGLVWATACASIQIVS